MKNIVFATALLLIPFLSFGQIKAKEYTHNSDFVITSAKDLYGFPIHPKEGRLSSSPMVATVKLNLVEFRITPSTLYVIEKVKYSSTGISSENDLKEYKLTIQQILPTASGYELVLMELRNPDIQGHLKVNLDAKYQIATLQFKPSPSEPERTYALFSVPNDINTRDGKFFSHEEETNGEIEAPLDIWAKKRPIFPFIETITHGEEIYKRRLYPSDRVKFAFEERTELKGKKEKLQQYVIYTTADENGQEVKKEYLVKKIKEISLMGNANASIKTIDLTLEQSEEGEEMVMRIQRTPKKMIQTISLNKSNGDIIKYNMRQGKKP